MDDRSFLTGLELGRYLTALNTRIGRLERAYTGLRGDFDTMKARARRLGILATLWSVALFANLEADLAAQIAVKLMESVLRR